MSHTLVPADLSHYYQRLEELSTLPFWRREEFTEPAGPECGHVWHWRDVYPELARSRHFAADAASLQRRALILRNPGLTPPAAGATPTIAAAYRATSSSPPAGAGTATSTRAAASPWCGWTASTSRSCWACGPASSATTRIPATRCPARDTTGTAAGTAALLPAGTRHAQCSPVRRYPWDQAYSALRTLMPDCDGS